MPKPRVVCIDFETDGIAARPDYPPKPVGVAILIPGKKPKYYAWDHPIENNCSKEDGVRALQAAIDLGLPLLCHNARFDVDVAETHCGIIWPWSRTHDTQILAYLADPHAKQIGLKPLAERWLDMPPDEQEAVRDWLYENGVVRRGLKGWGAFIAKAPGKLVGKYAIGDVVRTVGLFDKLYLEIEAAGMLDSYRRELELLPILLANEREGMQVDTLALRRDSEAIRAALVSLDGVVKTKIRCADINLDSDAELADALDAYQPGIKWPLTEKGSRSTTKEVLSSVLVDKELVAMLQYRASMQTCVGTFMEPWLAVAERTNGRIHTSWQTIKGEGGGTRTGRLSSSPNFQNIPTLASPRFAEVIALHQQHLGKYGWPELPAVRSYIVADTKNHVLCDRDFSQQELRVLAHFESGVMMEAYHEDPKLDLHQFAADTIQKTVGIGLTRKATKTLAFGLLYGMGQGELATRLGVTVNEAAGIKKAYLTSFPGIRDIQQELQQRARSNLPMTTWGGRRYYVEPPKVINGVMREFGYKLFNFLIQGSSADVTKEAVIRYAAAKKESRLILTVHDQIIICAPKKAWKTEMAILKEAMDGIPLDVPLLSDGEVGYRWGQLEGTA